MSRRVVFPNRLLPYLLLAPQIAITLVFFFWPAFQAVRQSLYRDDPFGFSSRFVGLANFELVLSDPNYINSLKVTVVFSLSVAIVALVAALVLAVMADRVVKGKGIYQTLLIWPYAVAPAIAGMLWLFLFSPAMGTLAVMLQRAGFDWNPLLNGDQAMAMVVGAAAWKQISYNFLFFFAALQSIPRSLVEAAAIDGAGPIRRFFRLSLPLIAPVSFFLLVVNLVYAFFDTFPVIDAATAGGPVQATTTLIYKIYREGFAGLDLSASAAQSVVLMLLVIVLTVVQFRYVERRVRYQ